MMSRALASNAVASDWTPAPGLLQRNAGRLAEVDRLMPSVPADRRGRNWPRSIAGGVTAGDFSRVPAHAAPDIARISDDALTPAGSTATSPSATTAGQTTAGSAAAPGNAAGNTPAAPQQGQGTPVNGKVTSLDVVTGATGAVTGFPAITGGGSLDSPGVFNDTTTGSCKNIHQMKFTVTGIPSSELQLLRMIDRTATAAGNKHVHKGKDGPSAPTVLRPTSSLVAVADSPGYIGHGHSTDFPVSYNADFKLYGYDIVSKTILAELDYKVAIAKSALTDNKPTNQITVTRKVLK